MNKTEFRKKSKLICEKVFGWKLVWLTDVDDNDVLVWENDEGFIFNVVDGNNEVIKEGEENLDSLQGRERIEDALFKKGVTFIVLCLDRGEYYLSLETDDTVKISFDSHSYKNKYHALIDAAAQFAENL